MAESNRGAAYPRFKSETRTRRHRPRVLLPPPRLTPSGLRSGMESGVFRAVAAVDGFGLHYVTAATATSNPPTGGDEWGGGHMTAQYVNAVGTKGRVARGVDTMLTVRRKPELARVAAGGLVPRQWKRHGGEGVPPPRRGFDSRAEQCFFPLKRSRRLPNCYRVCRRGRAAREIICRATQRKPVGVEF